MAINKVVYGNQTLIDITDTTALASDVAQGKEFYGPDGNKVVGTASGGITPTGTIAISQNGTYDVTNYASANVNVSGGGSFTIDDAQYLFGGGARLNIMNDLLGLCNNVTNSSYMFYNCSSLTSLNLSNFNTSNITLMQGMFNNCSGLTSLNLSNFNTSRVTNMSYMFSNCANLSSLDSSNFNTSRVTTMSYMFYNCSSLTSLDLSNFKLSEVTTMNNMFQNCSNLTSLEIGTDDTTYSTSLTSANLFNGCSSLDSVTIRGTNVMRISASNAFTNLKSTCKFYVPSNLLSAYKSATNWSTRANYIYAIS